MLTARRAPLKAGPRFKALALEYKLRGRKIQTQLIKAGRIKPKPQTKAVQANAKR